MIASAGATHPRGFTILVIVVAAAAALALAVTHPVPIHPLVLAVAFVVMGAAEMGAVPLPAGGTVSVGGALDVACLLVLGPFATAWLDVTATLLAQGLVQRRPPAQVAYNAAAFSLTALAAGAAFHAAGGTVGRLSFPDDLLPLLACGVT